MRRSGDLRREGEAGRRAVWRGCSSTRWTVRRRLDDLRQDPQAIDPEVDRHRASCPEKHSRREPGRHPAFQPIHHVQLAIPRRGEDACHPFWGGVLGMRELDEPPLLAARGGSWFRGGALDLHFSVEEPFAPARQGAPRGCWSTV